jgi:hypothetical protein
LTQVRRFWPILTGTHRYEKTLSTRGRGQGVFIQAPILAYLIETANGRILYDVGCDYSKVSNPELKRYYYENDAFPFGPPEMTQEQRLPNRLARLGLTPEDIDDEIAPGFCWQDREDMALASIGKLKAIAKLTGAQLCAKSRHDVLPEMSALSHAL